jgi:hypothetical protein
MPVAFKELGGSPVEAYNLEGFRAERQLLIAWEDRDAFAAELLGRAADHGSRTAVQYPGKPSVFAVGVRYEPFDPDNPDQKPLAGLAEGLNSYSSSFAKAIVEYATVTERDRQDGPPVEIGTSLTYKMLYISADESLLSDGWRWLDQPTMPLPGNLALVKTIPMTEHHLTWHEVVRPPWDTIHELQGKVNAGSFLGCSEGTMLFVGAEANKLFRSGFEAGPSEFCWELHYVFRERSIKQAGQVYGWNHAYRGDPPG